MYIYMLSFMSRGTYISERLPARNWKYDRLHAASDQNSILKDSWYIVFFHAAAQYWRWRFLLICLRSLPSRYASYISYDWLALWNLLRSLTTTNSIILYCVCVFGWSASYEWKRRAKLGTHTATASQTKQHFTEVVGCADVAIRHYVVVVILLIPIP